MWQEGSHSSCAQGGDRVADVTPNASDAPPRPSARCDPSEATARLTEAGRRFEVANGEVRGRPTRVWRNGPQHLLEIFEMTAAFAEQEFLVEEAARVTYRGFRRAAAAVSERLRAAGLAPGDRVALVLPNGVAWPVAFFGAMLAGGLAVPLSPELSPERLAWAARHAGARLVLTSAATAARPVDTLVVAREVGLAGAFAVEELAGPPADWAHLPEPRRPDAIGAPDDAAAIFYTSGTTATPKGVMLSHRALASAVLSREIVRARLLVASGASPERASALRAGTNLLLLPLSHVGGCCANLLPAMAGGGKLVFSSDTTADRAAELARREGAGLVTGAPHAAAAMRGEGGMRPAGGAVLQSGGAAHDGRGSGDSWGMTETAGAVTAITPPEQRLRPGSCGPASPVMELDVRTPGYGAPAPTGEVGELWVRGPQVMLGYWADPAATAATLVDGWLRSGDLARLDGEGFCYIVGRIGEAVRAGGRLVPCRVLESLLLRHPQVADAAVVAAREGAVALALVTLTELGTDVGVLADRVAGEAALARDQLQLCVVPGPLPRGATGKLSRDAVWARFAGS